MSVLEAAAILVAGGIAGTINTVVGSGTLVTFPVLLAFGYPPVVANVSNTIGLIPGSVGGALGYRPELTGQRRAAVQLGGASVLGGVVGAVGLLVLPASAFRAIVPVFIALALALILMGPRINRTLAARGAGPGEPDRRAATVAAIFASGVYGGYFGAAQGILLLAILGLGRPDDPQRTNALKVVLAGLVNLVAGLVFALIGPGRLGARRPARRGLDGRRPARRPRGPAALPRRPARGDRRRRRRRHRQAAGLIDRPSAPSPLRVGQDPALNRTPTRPTTSRASAPHLATSSAAGASSARAWAWPAHRLMPSASPAARAAARRGAVRW